MNWKLNEYESKKKEDNKQIVKEHHQTVIKAKTLSLQKYIGDKTKTDHIHNITGAFPMPTKN